MYENQAETVIATHKSSGVPFGTISDMKQRITDGTYSLVIEATGYGELYVADITADGALTGCTGGKFKFKSRLFIK